MLAQAHPHPEDDKEEAWRPVNYTGRTKTKKKYSKVEGESL